MRHRVKHRKLNRTSEHRAALLRNLSISLIKHKRIKTTVAKAKELRIFVEPLITRARKSGTHNARLVMAALRDKEAVKELMGNIAQTVGNRPGGYTRIVKAGFRPGDGGDAAIIELVDFNEAANQRAAELKEAKEAAAEAKKSAEKVEDAKVVE